MRLNQKQKEAKWKIVRNVISVVAAILIAAVMIAGILFRHELKTLSSLKEYKPGVYTMTYDGDYGFDTFLKYGATSDKDIEEFVTKRLLKGIPIKINVTDAGCTAFVSTNENGEVIFARNFDFEYAPFMQIYTNPDNGYASISTVNLELVGICFKNILNWFSCVNIIYSIHFLSKIFYAFNYNKHEGLAPVPAT